MIDIIDNNKNYTLVKLAAPINLMQIRILRKDIKLTVKGQTFESKTQSTDIEDIIFFASNLRDLKASTFELVSRITKQERLTRQDCIVPIEKGVGEAY